MRRIIGATAVLGLLGLGCMTYDFQPVQPLAIAQTRTGGVIRAKKLKPNLMLLVDKSGSMNDPASAGGSPKITELRNAMQTFLGQNGNVARMGVAFFPADNTSCGASASIAQTLPPPSAQDDAAADAANIASAQAVLSKIQAAQPGGGTPTGNSLEYVGTTPGLNEDDRRGDFIVLLTDGLPNCNAQNPNSCENPAVCQCTLATCGAAGSPYCTLGCLDQSGVVEKITYLARLKDKNGNPKPINVIVIGFGADTAGAAQVTLNAMAEAGGFPRACPGGTDTECGTNNSCDQGTKLCRVKYYQSSSGAQLAQDLTNIGNLIGSTDPCVYPLDTTATLDPKFISVEINGQSVNQGPDTWTLAAGNTIVFAKNGSTCQQILSSTEQSPVIIDVRALEQL